MGTEADDITGNVLFMFLEIFNAFGIPVEILPSLYIAGAFIMPVQRILVAILAAGIAVPLFKVFEKKPVVRWPLT